jgi:hypothetical protein
VQTGLGDTSVSATEIPTSEESERQNSFARRYTQLIGVMPTSFSGAIKDLMDDQANGATVLSSRSEFQVGRVMRGPTALAVLYWGSKTFCPDKMPAGWIYSSLQLARFYQPATLAAILAYTYLFKRIKRIVNPEEWPLIGEPMQKNIEICGLLSWHINDIGPTIGLIGGGIMHAAFACYSAHDKKGYAEYRRYLKIKKLYQDPSYELKAWGCTSVQIASQLLLQAGFGIPFAHEFVEGFRDPEPIPNAPRASGPFVSVRRWLEELSGRSLQESHTAGSNSKNITDSTTPELVEKLKTIARQGSLHHWLQKGSEDIGPEQTPDLLLDGVVFK